MSEIPTSLHPQEKNILEILRKQPKGADTAMLLQMSTCSTEKILVTRLNSLSEKQMVDFVQVGSTLTYKARNMAEVTKTKGLQPNDRLIYNIIRAVNDKGIWVKDITTQSNMHQNMVTNSIKVLEKKNLIKTIKSVKFPTKKLYMLSEFEPSSELTGGVWYTGDVLDLEFIEALSTQCYKVIYAKTFPSKQTLAIRPSTYENYTTAKEMLSYIKKTGITMIELTVSDVQQLLERLVYDSKVVKRLKTQYQDKDYQDDQEFKPKKKQKKMKPKKKEEDSDSEIIGVVDGYVEDVEDDVDWEDATMYVAVKNEAIPPNTFPCVKCPVFDFCSKDGPVNPGNCEYMSKWLEF